MRNFLAALVTLCTLAGPVNAQSVTITGTVNAANGAVGTFGPITVTIDAVNITSAVVDKPVAPVGTLRTLTVVATSTSGSALSAPLPTAPGITFTPVSGQPAGTFKWTFTY